MLLLSFIIRSRIASRSGPCRSLATSGWQETTIWSSRCLRAARCTSRMISYAMVVLLRTWPRPSQIGQLSVVRRVTLSRTLLRVISTRPMSLILRTLVLARSAPRASWRVLKTFSRLDPLSMSMKSMMMIPPMLRRRSW